MNLSDLLAAHKESKKAPAPEAASTKSLSDFLADKRAIVPQGQEQQQQQQESSPLDAVTSLDVSATAPAFTSVPPADNRALPELLTSLEEKMETKEISGALADVIKHINGSPETVDLLRPEEIGLIVRACAKSYTAVVATKQTRTKTVKKTAAKVAEAMDALKGISF